MEARFCFPTLPPSAEHLPSASRVSPRSTSNIHGQLQNASRSQWPQRLPHLLTGCWHSWMRQLWRQEVLFFLLFFFLEGKNKHLPTVLLEKMLVSSRTRGNGGQRRGSSGEFAEATPHWKWFSCVPSGFMRFWLAESFAAVSSLTHVVPLFHLRLLWSSQHP